MKKPYSRTLNIPTIKAAIFIFILSVNFVAHSCAQANFSLNGNPIVTTGWTLSGSAVNNDSEIVLTNSAVNQGGSINCNTPVNITNCGYFTIDYDFRFSNPGGGGVGNGIACYISNSISGFSNTGGMYLPSSLNGMLFTLDSWDNDADGKNPEAELFSYSTPTSYSEGDYTDLLPAHNASSVLGHQSFITDGNWHHIEITYNAGAITVSNEYGNLISGTIAFTGSGYLGFSASTGSGYSTQSIRNVSVYVGPIAPIEGLQMICTVGDMTNFADNTTGGTWSSSDNSVAQVDIYGNVTGVSLGTATITYSAASTCGALVTTSVVSVGYPPLPIIGDSNICIGSSVTLSDAMPFGSWMPSEYTFISCGFDGTITGLAPGVDTITYVTGDCWPQIIMTVHNPPVVSVPATTVICNGSGSLITASGALSYSWAPSTGLSATTGASVYASPSSSVVYTVTGSAYGCSDSVMAAANLNPRIFETATKTNVMCNGTSTGSVSISGSGGVLPLKYAIGSGAYSSSGLFNTLGANTDTFHIKDASGCIKDTIISITQPTAIIGNATIVNVACYGGTGSVTFAPAGGVTPYNFAVGSGSYSTSSVFSGLVAGTYIFHIKDANGCIKDTTISLTQPSAIVAHAAITNIVCNGGTGSVTFAPTGGTSPFSYANGTGSYSSSASFTALLAGTYTFHVKDAGGCIKDSIITFTQPTAITGHATITNVLCNGGTNGRVSFAPTGGGVPYNFAMGGGAFSSTAVFSGLVAGTNTFHIKDASGCIKDTTITITQPGAINGNATITNVICNGGTGSVTFGPAGGVAPYTFAYGTGAFATSATFSGLIARVDTFHIKDASGCIKDTIITITQPPAMRANATITNALCNGGSGSVNFAPTGGVSPYTFAKGVGTYTSSAAFTGIAASTITFHIKDASGCIKDSIITITQPTAIVSHATVTNVLCNGSNNGGVTLAPTGGVPPYTYANGGGAYSSTATFSGLSPATYTFHTRDANACIKDSIVTITQPAVLAVTATQTNVLCFGANNGIVIINPTGGTAPYLYANGTGAYSSSNVFSSLAPGTYTFHTKDANACIKDTTITITQPTAISRTASVANCTCNGSNNGKVTLSASGGTSPYTYASGTGAYSSTATFTGLPAGTATYHVKDANGCIKDTNLTITQPTAITRTVAVTQVFCNGGNNGKVVVTASGGTGALTYAAGSGTYNSSNTLTGFTAGSYTIHVKDANGCIKDTSLTITQPTGLTALLSSTPVLCYKGTTGSMSVTVSGGIAPYKYSWSRGDTVRSVTNVAAGNYIIVVKDANGCQYVGVDTVRAVDSITVVTSIVWPNCHGDCTGRLSSSATGGTAPFTYKWNGVTSTGTISSLCPGTYSLTVTDANSCTSKATYTITNPPAVTVNLGPDQSVCHNQVVVLNAGIKNPSATFSWGSSSGFTSTDSTISAIDSANYWVKVTTTAGCIARDTVLISRKSMGLDIELLSSTEAFADSLVAFVNATTPNPDSISWIIPSSASITKQSVTNPETDLIFKDTGTYVIGLNAYTKGCKATVYDTVNVVNLTSFSLPAAVSGPFIDSFTVAPNPNSGNFNVSVVLAEVAPIRVRIYNVSNYIPVSDKRYSGNSLYNLPYNLTLTPGLYIILLETPLAESELELLIL